MNNDYNYSYSYSYSNNSNDNNNINNNNNKNKNKKTKSIIAIIIFIIFLLICGFITIVLLNSNDNNNNQEEDLDNNKLVETTVKQKIDLIYNNEIYSVEVSPEEIGVTLKGKIKDVEKAKQKLPGKVTLDLSSYSIGNYSVEVKIKEDVSSVEYILSHPSVDVVISDKKSVEKNIVSSFINSEQLSVNIDGIFMDRESVIVKGSQSNLDKIVSVKALIDANKLNDSSEGTVTLKDIPLMAFDIEGEKIDVDIIPSSIEVIIDTSLTSKEVPIKLITEKELVEGVLNNITSSIDKIVIYGNKDKVNSIEYLPVSIDLSKIDKSDTFSVNLVKPNGIKKLSQDSITISIDIFIK